MSDDAPRYYKLVDGTEDTVGIMTTTPRLWMKHFKEPTILGDGLTSRGIEKHEFDMLCAVYDLEPPEPVAIESMEELIDFVADAQDQLGFKVIPQ